MICHEKKDYYEAHAAYVHARAEAFVSVLHPLPLQYESFEKSIG